MPQPSSSQLTPQQLSFRLDSLSEPVRLRILVILTQEELSVGEVARVLQLPQSTVSRHLKRLSEPGWLFKRAVGTATLYRFDPSELDQSMGSLWMSIAGTLDGAFDLREDQERLQAVLAARPTDSKAFFGRIAGQWDTFRRELFGDRFTTEALLSLVNPWWRVADLGCGTGDAAAWLGPRVDRLIAIDRSEVMLDAARTRLAGVQSVEFVQGDLEALPLADASVDAAVSLLVLHHIPDTQRAIDEMARVLGTDAGGGVALLVDMLEHDRVEYRQSMGHLHLGFCPLQIAAQMRDAGFARVEMRELGRETQGKGPGLFAAAGWLDRT